jgi:hypothetical protein
MRPKGNRLCMAEIKNHNPKSPIDRFVLVTVREFNDDEGGTYIDQINTAAEFLSTEREAYDEPFYQVYGKRYMDDVMSGPMFLGEFYDLDKALNFLYYLTGEEAQVVSY